VIGGPVQFISDLIALNRQSGHELVVACLDDPSESFVRDFPGELHALGPSSPGYGFTRKFVSWLRQERKKFDAVVVHGLWQYPSFGTWLALRGSTIPYVIFPHGMLDPWFKRAYPFRHLKKFVYWRMAEYRVLKDARAVLFTSETERHLAAHTFTPYECRQIVVGLGTAKPPANPAHMKAAFLEKYPDLCDKQIMLFLGRIHEKKGCDLLLEAWHKIATKYPKMTLVMAGPYNGYGESLKQQYERSASHIAESVIWTGHLSGDLKWGALYAADCLVLPSHQENFGIVVAEALACGKPVLISTQVNIYEDVLEENAGLVEADDLEGTERLLGTWLNMTGQQKRDMQNNAKRCFQERFEISIVNERLMSVLEAEVAVKNTIIK
jgi:glycosyltransferase involved in cell wall biosynthesis